MTSSTYDSLERSPNMSTNEYASTADLVLQNLCMIALDIAEGFIQTSNGSLGMCGLVLKDVEPDRPVSLLFQMAPAFAGTRGWCWTARLEALPCGAHGCCWRRYLAGSGIGFRVIEPGGSEPNTLAHLAGAGNCGVGCSS